jgi:bifunctional non-homologous end joining protein LigD
MNIEPMLLTEVDDPLVLDDATKIFQEKHNGVRAIVHIKGGKIVGIRNRANNPILFCFPELKEAQFDFDTAILDCEICVIKDNKSVFYGGIDQRRSAPTEKKLKENPATIVVFDILQYEGEALVYKPYKVRVEYLARIKDKIRGPIQVIESTHDGRALWDKIVAENREGVVIKDPNAIYELGKRSKQSLKLKNYKYVDVLVQKTEVNEKGTKIFSVTMIDGKDIQVECQQAGCFNIHEGDTVRVKYLDIVGEKLIQPTRT